IRDSRITALVSQLKVSLAEAESNRERAEKAMDTITTQREYEALDKEIREASEKEQQYRKELQREEKNLVVLSEEIQREAALVEEQERDLAQRRAGIEQELAEKRAELEALKEREREVTAGLDPEVVFKFERIIRNKMGLGIVPIKGGVCNGCHMILPVQFANMVRSGAEIVFCPYCSRILYYEESEEGEMEFFNEEDAGSLSDLEDFDLDEEYDEEQEEEEEEDDEKVDMDFDE
ncbi:MAG: C4-type zinc ribbon domain-containing protein, partial [Treponemataceae bacterium]|nr:C4-type zinc ribbon domain-containing protein [Treponemataceae bacterium]